MNTSLHNNELTGRLIKLGEILSEHTLSFSGDIRDGGHRWTWQNITRSTMSQQELSTDTLTNKNNTSYKAEFLETTSSQKLHS